MDVTRILFVSQTRSWSGAEVAMMRLVDALRAEHEIGIACPAGSHMAEVAESTGLKLFGLPPVDCSLRLDPVWTTVGVGQFLLGGARLRRAACQFKPDVVHANSIRAGLLGAIAFGVGKTPMVVQAHEHLPASRIGRAVRSVIAASAASVVGVSDHTVTNFNQGLGRSVAKRVYISIDQSRFRRFGLVPAPVREELSLSPDTSLLGQVAQISPWKGQDIAIRMLAELRRRGIAADLLIVGHIAFAGRGVRYDNVRFLRELHDLAQELGMRDWVHFLGWREDLPELLRAMNLSVLPSRDEPFGISVAESMAVGTPALVSAGGGPCEYIVDRKSGRVLPGTRHELWAKAAHELLDNRPALARMAEEAREAVAGFTDECYTREMLDVYTRVM
jgi:L-malate glycosyltransferase